MIDKIHDKINITTISEIKELVLQDFLGPMIDEVVKSFDTGLNQSSKKIADINKDIDNAKNQINENMQKIVENENNLDELLIKSKELKQNSQVYKKESDEVLKASKSKTKLIILIITINILILIGLYFLIAFLRCRSVNLFC